MTASGSPAQTVSPNENVMEGRSAFILRADWGHVSVLEGGGHAKCLRTFAAWRVPLLPKGEWTLSSPGLVAESFSVAADRFL